MGDITVVAAKVGLSMPGPAHAEVYPVIAGVVVTAGLPLYQQTDGTYAIALASAAATARFRGISLNAAHIGGKVDMLKRGVLTGYALGTYGDTLYLSDTAGGAISDTPGTVVVRVGTVISRSDPALTELWYCEADWKDGWEDDA